MGTSAAPLYKALAGSQLGKEVIGGGLADYKHLTFSAGLMGIPQEQGNVSDAGAGAAEGTTGHLVNQNAVDRIENIVLETLEKCARNGFEPDAIEAAMNTVEFHLREMNTGTYPKGLAIILQILSDWMVDR
ncbi:uncharacterized protein, partial [Physeter macrocephalus]|uniref:Uncharacterized protein n=1 Tax=Physeter macrocephalus TaxID=9755 RepID=A0A455B4L5_PHYMC